MTRCLDSDGAHINLLVLTLIVKHLPQLIHHGKVFVAVPPLFKASSGRKTTYFYSNEELESSSVKGEITRYKGIGEMNHEELWETTMNPENRNLIQITTENFNETLKLFQILMGSSSQERRNFIETNGLFDETTDFFGEGED